MQERKGCWTLWQIALVWLPTEMRHEAKKGEVVGAGDHLRKFNFRKQSWVGV